MNPMTCRCPEVADMDPVHSRDLRGSKEKPGATVPMEIYISVVGVRGNMHFADVSLIIKDVFDAFNMGILLNVVINYEIFKAIGHIIKGICQIIKTICQMHPTLVCSLTNMYMTVCLLTLFCSAPLIRVLVVHFIQASDQIRGKKHRFIPQVLSELMASLFLLGLMICLKTSYTWSKE